MIHGDCDSLLSKLSAHCTIHWWFCLNWLWLWCYQMVIRWLDHFSHSVITHWPHWPHFVFWVLTYCVTHGSALHDIGWLPVLITPNYQNWNVQLELGTLIRNETNISDEEHFDIPERHVSPVGGPCCCRQLSHRQEEGPTGIQGTVYVSKPLGECKVLGKQP